MNSIVRNIIELTPAAQEMVAIQFQIIRVHQLPFDLFETWRSDERQTWCFKTGASKVEHSNHQDRIAWDWALWINGQWKWDPIYWFQVLGIITLATIKGIRWGADWNGKNFWFDEKFKDFCHWELIKK